LFEKSVPSKKIITKMHFSKKKINILFPFLSRDNKVFFATKISLFALKKKLCQKRFENNFGFSNHSKMNIASQG
jgi:hypothetical protein